MVIRNILFENYIGFQISFNKIIEIKKELCFGEIYKKNLQKKLFWKYGKIGLIWKFKKQTKKIIKNLLHLNNWTKFINLLKINLIRKKPKIKEKFFFL
jgi:hypothetical protein